MLLVNDLPSSGQAAFWTVNRPEQCKHSRGARLDASREIVLYYNFSARSLARYATLLRLYKETQRFQITDNIYI